MSEKESLAANFLSEYVTEDHVISKPERYIIIWLDFADGGRLGILNYIYAYLWQNVDVSNNRFTNCTSCKSHIVSLRDQEKKLFIIITDPKKPMVQRDLFLLWSHFLFEPNVAKIYIIQTIFDFTFYRYWLRFKQHQEMYFVPNETLLLEQLEKRRTNNTCVICLETGTSEIVDIGSFEFIKIFSEPTKCLKYMTSIRGKDMILVINSQNSNVFDYIAAIKELFSTKYYLYMLSTLSAIYILTSTRTKQIGVKQTDLFTKFNVFQKHLEKDISTSSSYLCNDELMDSSSSDTLKMSLRSVSTQQFYYYANLIARMPQTTDAQTEMIEECLQCYQDNPYEIGVSHFLLPSLPLTNGNSK